MAKNAIIVGMPRSGTSLAASIFAKQGYFAAEDQQKELRAADEFNPTGYWESEAITKFNSEVFSRVGFEQDNTWLYSEIKQEQAKAINDLEPQEPHKKLIETYNRHSPWVLKDPRFCYTVGYWWSIVDRENTRVLLVKRDPKHILNSFLRLNWRSDSVADRDDVLKRIASHLAAAEYAIKKFNIPHLSIQYSDYENQPEQTAALINEYFDLNLTASDLGYSRNFNNSSFRGKIETGMQRVADKLPISWVKLIKHLIPKFIKKRLFPAKS